MSPPHAKVPPRVPVCSAAPRSLLHVFSVEQEVHGSSGRWDIPWNCPQDNRGAADVTWKQQQRRRLERAELRWLSAHWHNRKPGREAGCRMQALSSACTVTCSGSMTPEPSIMSDSGSQAVICHLVYGTWAWLSRFPLLDDNRGDRVVGEENLLEQLVSFFLVHTQRTLCYHCEDYMAAFDFLTKVPACSLLPIICD